MRQVPVQCFGPGTQRRFEEIDACLVSRGTLAFSRRRQAAAEPSLGSLLEATLLPLLAKRLPLLGSELAGAAGTGAAVECVIRVSVSGLRRRRYAGIGSVGRCSSLARFAAPWF